MTRDRWIQLAAVPVLALSALGAGMVLPRLIDQSDEHLLRYTDVSVEGAPPIVVLGSAIGAVRGLIVDYLWIKLNIMKEEGKFYEIMADADLITKLQPRFAAVWATHGHNMAYNVSVATHTEEERWEWVKAGINLVRNKGIRYNPNDLNLHRELAFWFAHKLEGISDDAHLYYKREFCREWHAVLGEPPVDYIERVAWIKAIADAPRTLDEADARTPGVKALVERLRSSLSPYEQQFRFALDVKLLRAYSEWEAARGRSAYAQLLGIDQQLQQSSKFFQAFDAIASDEEIQPQWRALIAHLRKRTLLDDYNMDPHLMYEYTRDLGPLDWRHGSSHALYWARKGSQYGEVRVVKEDDVYKIMNNDRHQLHAMQELARWGRISFDPFSTDYPARFPDPRWIEAIDKWFDHFYVKHFKVRGWGGDTFIAFHQNFLGSAIRQLYHSGEPQLAQRYLDRLDSLYGQGSKTGATDYSVPLDVFVWQRTKGEYESQPHVAPGDVAAALRYGYIVGLGEGRPEVFEQTIKFAQQVTEWFKTNEVNAFDTKFGTGRMKDLLGQLEATVPAVFGQVITDSQLPLLQRLMIYSQAPDWLQQRVYDQALPQISQQFQSDQLSRSMTLATVFPEPSGMEQYRREEAARQARQAEKEQQDASTTIDRR
jgi:hypothetical protein